MTEMVNGMAQGQDTSISQPVITPSTSDNTNSPTAAEEKFFRQSEINDIVKKAKYGAVEDYKRQVADRPDYMRQKDGDVNYGQHQQPERASRSLSDEDIRRVAVEEVQRLRDQHIADATQKSQEQDAQRIVNEFFTKLSTGKDKYQDFDQVIGDVDYGRFPNVVQLLNNYIDNTHDVMYELGKDRSKLAVLEQLSHMSPRDAVVQVQKLSKSIKDNEAAGKIRQPNQPLSQMKPSNTGTDNGAMSVKDYRSKYKV